MPNHWQDKETLIVEEKTLFRQVGWHGQSGRFYTLASPPHSGQANPEASFCAVYEQIAKWSGEGWDD